MQIKRDFFEKKIFAAKKKFLNLSLSKPQNSSNKDVGIITTFVQIMYDSAKNHTDQCVSLRMSLRLILFVF